MSLQWPESTNKGTALLKLAHQFQERVILRDDFLGWFFDAEIVDALRADPPDFERPPRSPAEEFQRIAYWYAILRERCFDEAVTVAVRAGFRQLLLLGSGYDTRFFRLPEIAGRSVAVFEVDTEATIADKQARIEARLGRLPARLTLVPLDLARKPLATLIDRGLDPSSPTLCVWQGVSYYLSRESVSNVLDFVRTGLAAGSRLALDAAGPLLISPNETIPGIAFNIERLARIGEPYHFGMEPKEMKAWLARKGFRRIRVVGQERLEWRYLKRHTIPRDMWYVVTARTPAGDGRLHAIMSPRIRE